MPGVEVKIISGGQSGVDRAALDVAIDRGIPAGGWCPANRRAEDGPIPEHYPLLETRATEHSVRTRLNVKAGDGTLVLNLGVLSEGTLLTVEYAGRRHKPCLLVQLDDPAHPRPEEVVAWLVENRIRILNVAGPRESKRPGIYRQSYRFLAALLGECSAG